MSSFFDSIFDEDAKSIRKQLEEDPKFANAVHDEMTPLLWACQLELPEIVHVLLEFGANPNECMDDGESPLHVAAFEGCETCVQMLLENGADINAATKEGKTPLMNASQGGFEKIIRSLLEAGSSPLIIDNMGRTVLHWAILGSHDDVSVLHLLLSYGVDPEAKNDNGDTALDYARLMARTAMEHALRRLG